MAQCSVVITKLPTSWTTIYPCMNIFNINNCALTTNSSGSHSYTHSTYTHTHIHNAYLGIKLFTNHLILKLIGTFKRNHSTNPLIAHSNMQTYGSKYKGRNKNIEKHKLAGTQQSVHKNTPVQTTNWKRSIPNEMWLPKM